MTENTILIPFAGEIAAISAALFWALASVVYSRLGQKISPIGLNLIKGIIAIVLLIFTIVLRKQNFPDVPIFTIQILLLSGLIGIGIGDSAYFATLKYLGARRGLLLETLAPPLTAILAFIFLGERLSIQAWCGIFLTILGIAWVISERTSQSSSFEPHFWRGIGFGLIAEFCQATGVILSHFALNQTEISPLWSSLIRLIGGTAIVLLYFTARPQNLTVLIKPLKSKKVIAVIFIATFLGTYLGIWLQQTSLKFTAAGIAQALLATSPLFVLPIAAGMGEKVSLQAIGGALIAILGVILLFQG
ncbi:MAG: DMT family transporter [Microcoleaceae cyanobacterium]